MRRVCSAWYWSLVEISSQSLYWNVTLYWNATQGETAALNVKPAHDRTLGIPALCDSENWELSWWMMNKMISWWKKKKAQRNKRDTLTVSSLHLKASSFCQYSGFKAQLSPEVRPGGGRDKLTSTSTGRHNLCIQELPGSWGPGWEMLESRWPLPLESQKAPWRDCAAGRWFWVTPHAGCITVEGVRTRM